MSSQPLSQVAGSSIAARTLAPRSSSATNGTSSGNTLPPAGARSGTKPASLADAVSELNDHVQNIQRDLEFTIDSDSGRTVIKVVDSRSKEVLRQIPPKEILQLASTLKQLQDGTILRVKA